MSGQETYKDDCPPERAVIVSDGRRSEAVDWIGEGLDQWIQDSSPMNVFTATPGVWIWEGHVDGEKNYRRLVGSYRALTDREWDDWVENMQAGGVDIGPWDATEWVQSGD